MATQAKNNSNYSVPVQDSAEAEWHHETALAIGDSNNLWHETEGELAIDVYLTNNHIVIRTVVAGVATNDISISVHNDLLTIRGKRHEETSGESKRYILQECHWGVFSRSLVLPVPVQPDSAEASMKNGVLTVRVERAAHGSVPVPIIEKE